MIKLYGGGVGSERRVRDLDEEGLLAAFVPLLPQGSALVPTGDDAAVMPVSDSRFVVTTDVLVEDRHFRREWSSGADIGWRAIMQNAADVGAMGAVPISFVVALVLPGDLAVSWVRDFAAGMAEACDAITAQTGVPCGVVGGDLSSGDSVVVAVTAHGDLQSRAPVLRSGARVGDVVAHAGTLGFSAAGLAALAAGLGRDDDVVRVHRRPSPPLAAAVVAAIAGAHAMMDVSDGLLRDAGRLAGASGVTIDLVPIDTLVDPRLLDLAGRLGEDAAQWVAGGGEDHGYLATFAPGSVPAGFDVIGRVVARGERDVLVAGRPPALRVGWDHFASGG